MKCPTCELEAGFHDRELHWFSVPEGWTEMRSELLSDREIVTYEDEDLREHEVTYIHGSD